MPEDDDRLDLKRLDEDRACVASLTGAHHWTRPARRQPPIAGWQLETCALCGVTRICEDDDRSARA